MCGRKNCYGKNQVKKVRTAIGKVRTRRLRSYECTICGYYHLTSEL